MSKFVRYKAKHDVSFGNIVIPKDTVIVTYNGVTVYNGYYLNIRSEVRNAFDVVVESVVNPTYVKMRFTKSVEIAGFDGTPYTEDTFTYHEGDSILVYTRNNIQLINGFLFDIIPILEFLEVVE